MSTRTRAVCLLCLPLLMLSGLFIAVIPAGTDTPEKISSNAGFTDGEKLPTADGVGPEPVGIPHAVTNANGYFRLEGLNRATHQVYLDVLTLPSDLRPFEDAPEVAVWLNPGQAQVSDLIAQRVRFSAAYDAGGSVIEGTVFVDDNLDGRQGNGELALSGVVVVDPEIHQYLLPSDDRNLIAMLDASNQCQSSADPVGDFLASRISITASSPQTTFYYDHWEDGYDSDPLSPGPTTVVDTLGAGQTRIFEDDINTADPNWGTTLYFGGGDRITIVGESISLIRGVSPSLTDSVIGTRLAGAWEIDETANWGTHYIIPVGEDLGARSDFEFTSGGFAALQDNTQVFRNGTPVAVLNAGQSYSVNGAGDGPGNGGLDGGEVISATGPINGRLYGSICDLTDAAQLPWSGNGYTLKPLQEWTDDYWSPVPSRTSGPACSNDANVDIFLYNSEGRNINLTIDDGTVYNTILPPGGSSVTALIGGQLSDSRGVHIQGDGQFWGIVNQDSRDTAHEWGYSLIPAEDLSSLVVLGWAPGNDNPIPISQPSPNGNLAFVTAVSDTVVYFDVNLDGIPDLMDCNGDGDANDIGVDGICDEPTSNLGVQLLQGQTLRIADPSDADMTGAAIYSRSFAQHLAVAWGQDPCVADPGLPYLDMGYTVLPVTRHILSIDKGDDPDPVIPGNLLTYTLLWGVAGDEIAPNVVVTDTMPLPYVSFVSCEPLPACQGETTPGSGVVTWNLGDRLSPDTGILAESGWLTMTVNVDQRPPGGVFTNTVIIDDDSDTPPDEDDEPTRVPDAAYALSKQRVTDSPVDIGEAVQFIIAITNTGSLTITHLPLVDTYDPTYLQYEDTLPQADSVEPGILTWNDLTSFLPGYGFVLPPAQSTQVWVEFTAITSTQHLSPPVTINTAVSEGALTDVGELPRQEDDADVGILDEGSTAIELLYFRANPKLGGVLVEWATLLEFNTARFWLYRSQDADFGHAAAVAFLPAQGWLDSGATYQYVDAGLAAGQYHYWLAEEENSGKRTVYGPVSAWSGWDEADFPFRVFLLAIQ